jgi:NADPH-dependent 2,4-dienoyl-CoA reductase/sulfur reductase-like enzyme/rhodanese-related sulfurtransferase
MDYTPGGPAMGRQILIVGGVAGGASAAARLRRLSEDARIVVFERGPHVSFANCGLPYFIGGEIAGKERLLVQSPEKLRAVFNLDVRVNSEVLALDRPNKQIEVRERLTGRTYRERYDDLILSTGAAPLVPPIPGIKRPGQFVLRNILDMEYIDDWVRDKAAQTAVVIGGGYIGLEMAEQLHRRGLRVSVVQSLPQVLAPFDPEMAALVHRELKMHGVALYLDNPVAGFEEPQPGETARASIVVLKRRERLPTDVVILGMGIRPETHLAKEAGLTIGARGGIRVDEHLRTSDRSIWAVGDAIEVRDWVTGEWSLIALAGPANRQGRAVADNILGRPAVYRGTLGTAVLRVFDLAAACTGANEIALRRNNIPFKSVHLHPNAHAGYFPGAQPIALKVLFSPVDGRLLGAQAIGRDGIDKRIDVLATALKASMTVHDLADLELAYAPPYGAAKDPINLAGMAAQNILNGDVKVVQWHEVAKFDPAKTIILDVREAKERAAGAIPNSKHIPLGELRERLAELPRDKEIIAHCQTGQRSYTACRLLSQHGFVCRNLAGSYQTWRSAQEGEDH